jgi:hypothetical protein
MKMVDERLNVDQDSPTATDSTLPSELASNVSLILPAAHSVTKPGIFHCQSENRPERRTLHYSQRSRDCLAKD